MYPRRVDDDDTSNISVSSSKYQRRLDRAAVLRKIIYLKRRCIRCYFVSLISAVLQLIVHGTTLYINYSIIYGQSDLFYSLCIYIAACVGLIIGSGICIYAMSKQLFKIPFIWGKAIMTLSMLLIAVASAGPYIFAREPNKAFGYPTDLIEDCEKFPDYTFAIVYSPIRKKGPPLGTEDNPDPQRTDAAGVVAVADAELLSVSSTTESYVTKSYPCNDMVSNVRWFQQSHTCMYGLLLIVTVTITLSYVGIIHLYWIHRKGLDYSILPPELVEPYTSYDELMKRNHSVTSIPSEISILHHQYVDIEQQREHYRKMNREFNINIDQVDHNVRGKAHGMHS